MTYLLEMNDDTPRQYRITVLEDNNSAIMANMINHNNDGFRIVGYYDTPEELMEVLEPHVHMETSR